jgi:Ca2+-binding RTX toxin-like protein
MGMFEHLENRSLYSVSYDETTGALTVTGTPGKDRVIFSEEILHETGKHVLRLHYNGAVQDFKKGSVRKIDIQTFEDDDLVILGTINIPSTINGGTGNDSLSGGDDKDVIDGGEGDDYIYGRKKADTLTGGPGYDLILGGPGNDQVIPFSDSFGDDTVSGGKGIDVVDYSNWPEPLFAYVGGTMEKHKESDKLLVGIERIIGSAFDDRIVNSTNRAMKLDGGAGNDTIIGGSGRDTITGGAGTDLLQGNGGKDLFVANDNEADTIDGGSGEDTVDPYDLGLDLLSNVP